MIIPVTDIQDPRLDAYRDLSRARISRKAPHFVVESRIVVHRLLTSGFVIDSIVCSETASKELIQTDQTRPDLPIFVLPRTLLRQLVGFRLHRGMLAAARRPSNPSLDQFIASCGTPSTIVVCPHVVDPVNLAGVIRNCMAFGVQGLILGAHSTDAFSRRVVRVSMGTIFELPVRYADCIYEDVAALGDVYEFERLGAVIDAQAEPLMQCRRPRRLALLFGSEGPGLDASSRSQCDRLITLPMKLGTDSLNLATATGVFLYHFEFVSCEG